MNETVERLRAIIALTGARKINGRGFVYIVKEQHGLIKIGAAKDAKKRFKILQTAMPYKLELVYFQEYDNYITVEQKLHKVFHKNREGGEWFKLSESDLTRLVHLMKIEGAKKEQTKWTTET